MAEAASLFLRLGGVGSSGDKPATTPSDQRDQRDQREDAINSCPRPRSVPRSQGLKVSWLKVLWSPIVGVLGLPLCRKS